MERQRRTEACCQAVRLLACQILNLVGYLWQSTVPLPLLFPDAKACCGHMYVSQPIALSFEMLRDCASSPVMTAYHAASSWTLQIHNLPLIIAAVSLALLCSCLGGL